MPSRSHRARIPGPQRFCAPALLAWDAGGGSNPVSRTRKSVMFAYTYILRCCDGDMYIGSTLDLKRCVIEDGKVPATAQRRPLELVYYEGCKSEVQARLRERAENRIRTVWSKVTPRPQRFAQRCGGGSNPVSRTIESTLIYAGLSHRRTPELKALSHFFEVHWTASIARRPKGSLSSRETSGPKTFLSGEEPFVGKPAGHTSTEPQLHSELLR